MPPQDREEDPEWCPHCEEKSARVAWSDNKDWSLTATFADLDDEESITMRRYCRQCGWDEKCRFTATIVVNDPLGSEEGQSDTPSIENIFDQ